MDKKKCTRPAPALSRLVGETRHSDPASRYTAMRVQRVTARRSQIGGERQLQLGDGLATGRRGPLGQQLAHRSMDGGAGHMSGLGGRLLGWRGLRCHYGRQRSL